MSNKKAMMLDKIKHCDMVLVGIGKECAADLSMLDNEERYKDIQNRIVLESKWQWIKPFIEKNYLNEYKQNEIKKFYEELENMLNGKNYFIVSLCTDDYIYVSKLNKQRITTPCGGYRALQCQKNCTEHIYGLDEKLLIEIEKAIVNTDYLEYIKRPVCAKCGAPLVFNNVKEEGYQESGYLEQWSQYKKWLQGTINNEICVLEFGCGMEYPSIIRWPFEKVAYYNQKSQFYRVHSKLYQLTDELRDRGISVDKNAIDFLVN